MHETRGCTLATILIFEAIRCFDHCTLCAYSYRSQNNSLITTDICSCIFILELHGLITSGALRGSTGVFNGCPMMFVCRLCCPRWLNCCPHLMSSTGVLNGCPLMITCHLWCPRWLNCCPHLMSSTGVLNGCPLMITCHL